MTVQSAFNRKPILGSIVCDIPDQREPEFGYILGDMADHLTIYRALASFSDITILPLAPTTDKFLVSLAEDTVNADGYPSRSVRALDLERRRRQRLYTDDNSLHGHDISYKDAQKTSMRREWEHASGCLRSGEEEIQAKIVGDIPGATILQPDSFRVSSICITARASYDAIHHLPQDNASIRYEICNDACVFTNPHADRVLGYRKEVELEAKSISVIDHRATDAAERNRLLDRSLELLESRLTALPFSGAVMPASISKVRHANDVVSRDYEHSMPPTPGIQSGLDWALLQNVRAWDFTFSNKRKSLALLTETIPPPRLLMPDSDPAALHRYFPEHDRYPLLPAAPV